MACKTVVAEADGAPPRLRGAQPILQTSAMHNPESHGSKHAPANVRLACFQIAMLAHDGQSVTVESIFLPDAMSRPKSCTTLCCRPFAKAPADACGWQRLVGCCIGGQAMSTQPSIQALHATGKVQMLAYSPERASKQALKKEQLPHSGQLPQARGLKQHILQQELQALINVANVASMLVVSGTRCH